MKDSFFGYNFEEIRKDFSQLINTIYGEHMRYSFFSGSVAYGGGKLHKSDIDIAVVLSDTYSQKDSHGNVLNDQLEFAKKYIHLNEKHGFLPDIFFPGELITESMLQDAVAGRGFSVKDEKLYLPKASVEYYLADPEHWFRAWLSMITFSVFASGDEAAFREAKVQSWKTVILFLILHSPILQISVNKIIKIISSGSNKWLGFGVTENYYLFPQYESWFVKKALLGLYLSGYLTVSSKDTFLPVQKRITEWNDSKVQALKTGQIKTSRLLFTMEETKELHGRVELSAE